MDLLDKALELDTKASNENLRKALRSIPYRIIGRNSYDYIATSHLMMLDFRNASKYFHMANRDLEPLKDIALWHGSDPEIINVLGIDEPSYNKYLTEKALANISMGRVDDEFFLDENKLSFVLTELSERGIEPKEALEDTIKRMEEAGKSNVPKKLLLARYTGNEELINRYQEEFDTKKGCNRKKIDRLVQEYCAFNGIKYIKKIQTGDYDNFFPVASNLYLIEKDDQKEVIKENLKLYTDFSDFSGYNCEKAIYEKLNHPNIINNLGEMNIDGIEFLRFKFFNGEELSSYTKKDNLLTIEEVYKIIKDHAEVLDYCHKQGIMYMDVKDKNVLYDSKNKAIKVLDFGMAQMQEDPITKDTIKRSLLSTPAYITPEWGTKFQIHNTTETFQLGVLFHQLLTGEHPFATHDFEDGNRESEIIKYGLPNIFNEYKAPNCDPKVFTLLHTMLTKDPNRRPTPGEVAENIGGLC